MQIDYSKLSDVLKGIAEAQEAESDMRQQAREQNLFIYATDGQWDPYAISKMDGRYRGTFDMCTPAIDQIAGEIDEADFSIKVSPLTSKSSEDTAKVMNGLIRTIRNISNFDDVISTIGRNNVTCGFDAFEIIQDYIDADTFDQDLFFKHIPNAIDTVWFEPGSVKQDRSDANWAVKMRAVTKDYLDREFPKEDDIQGLSSDEESNAYYNKADTILIGQIYYKKPIDIEIVRMSNGDVYRVDDKFEAVVDELAQFGVVEEDRRTRESFKVCSRLFSNNKWLGEEEETVFNMIPIIPIYGNFNIIENKVIYFGKVRNMMDEQRALNYAVSRDIEDGALSPAPTTWMTPAMAAGHDYSRMNTDRAPIRLFNPDPNMGGMAPQMVGGPQASSGLQTTIANMQQLFGVSSNSFAAQQGNADMQQSGIAGAQQIQQANIGSIKWFKPIQVALQYAGKVVVNAIPKAYDSTRQIRILQEDGTSTLEPINQPIVDQQTGQVIELNNLATGEYDVLVDYGPAFATKQQEAAAAYMDMASVDPLIQDLGRDIWLKNQSAPGMDQLGERVREQMLNDGKIPESQWTEEEKARVAEAQAQAAQEPQQPDPMMVAAQAEMQKAQADTMSAQNKQMEMQGNFQIKQQELEVQKYELQMKDKALALDEQKIQLDVMKFKRENDDKYNVDAAKIQQDQEKIELQRQKQAFEQFKAEMELQMKQVNDSVSNYKTLIDTERETAKPEIEDM